MFLLRKPSVLFDFLEMRFHYAIVKSILCRNWVFGPCYVNDLAFRGVKFHVSFMTLAFKVVKIFLENL